MRHTYITVTFFEALRPLRVREIAQKSKWVKLPDKTSNKNRGK